jgi:hypothetical protein
MVDVMMRTWTWWTALVLEVQLEGRRLASDDSTVPRWLVTSTCKQRDVPVALVGNGRRELNARHGFGPNSTAR